ncbi:hypothetical protein [Rhizobium grahamii]|uniref:hypothetical protein n=1 Tax=Rhizobium grahamii TaxID=1120045 RepID=UPI000315FB5D|nr:hypothetical protein [Rhizobium grahamii]
MTAGKPDPAHRLPVQLQKSRSKGRLGIDRTVLFGKRHGQISLGRSGGALGGIAGVLQFKAKFFDVQLDRHHLISLSS